MIVLSLFDGISAGRVALERAGIEVEKYYASEIDKYAISISQKNYPDTIQLGDVTKWKEWDIEQPDIIIGGSPCQGFSFAGKQLNFNDPRSNLFFEMVEIINHYNPKYYFLENVKMKKEYQDVISGYMGVEPIEINSALVSAQNRKRLYWFNWEVEQPEDKGIILADVLEYGDVSGQTLSKAAIERSKRKKYSKPQISPEKTGTLNTKNNSGQLSMDSGTTLIPLVKDHGEYRQTTTPDKAQNIDANYRKGPDNHGQRTLIQVGNATNIKGHDSIKRVYSKDGLAPTLTTMGGGHREPKVATDQAHYRKLTPIECERLQTFPDNYTEGVSNTQRYKALGNSWTVDVIAHIFKVRTETKSKFWRKMYLIFVGLRM